MRVGKFTVMALLLIGAAAASQADAALKKGFVPWSRTCQFGKYGKVIIDGTQKGMVYLKIGGKTYKTDAYGSAFSFGVENGPIIYFGPDQEWFEYMGLRDNHCVLSKGVAEPAVGKPAG